MAHRTDADTMKTSARAVWHLTDRFVSGNNWEMDSILNDLQILSGQWTVRLPAAAIILAGGKSERMGQDKSLLQLQGRPLIAHIAEQLRPHFRRILISTNKPDKYSFLGLECVKDEQPGQGPLMGIASALKASPEDLNFVIACDIPEVDIPLMKSLLRQARDCDGAVPLSPDGRIEPVYAVYRKSVLPALRTALVDGERKIQNALSNTSIKYVPLNNNQQPLNLNTPSDFEHFVKVCEKD